MLTPHHTGHLNHMAVVTWHLDVTKQTGLEHGPLAEPPPDFFDTVIQLFRFFHLTHIREKVNLFWIILGAEVDCPDGHSTDRRCPPIIIVENLDGFVGDDGWALG